MKKVLLTSSSKAFRERNMNLLMDKGFQLFTAATGAETLNLHQEHFFDLILSDLKLKDMDGCRLCHEVRKTVPSKHVPVVLICYDSVECMAQVEQSDATAVLLRPINPSELLVTIGSFIDMQLARSKRVAFNTEVLTRKQGQEYFSVAHDISATGILIETGQQLSLGDRLSCQFMLCDACLIQPVVEVARCIRSAAGKSLYGAKFIELSLPNRSAIEKYVALNNHLGIPQKPHHLLEKDLD